MPLVRFAAHGDWNDRRGSILKSNPDETTDRIVANPKAIENIHKAWSKLEQPASIHLVNAPLHYPKDKKPHYNVFNYAGLYLPDDIKSNRRIAKFADDINASSSEITVVYTTNFTGYYMPMTAWILAHRMAHVFHFNKNCGIVEPKMRQFYEFEISFWKCIVRSLEIFYRYAPDKDKFVLGDPEPFQHNQWNITFFLINSRIRNPYKDMRTFLNRILTMRSARTDHLTVVDASAELLAQFIITGSIKFNELTQDEYLYPRTLKADQANEINQVWKEFKISAEQQIDQLLDSLVGVVMVW